MKCCLLSTLFFCILFSLQAQVWDDFSDGEIKNNPQWQGDTDSFLVNEDFELQLNAPDAGQAYLFLNAVNMPDLEWIAFLELDFAPSANNYLRFYLSSGGLDPEGIPYGYYIQFGESGSEDTPKLFYYDEDALVLVTALESIDISAGFKCAFRFRYSTSAFFELDYAPQWAADWISLGQINAPFQLPGSQTGFFCRFTSSRTQNFWMDNFYCGPIQIDDSPPRLSHWANIDGSKFEFTFDEGIAGDQLSGDNFHLYPMDLAADAIFWTDIEPEKVGVEFPQALPANQAYKLCMQGIEDFCGNRQKDSCVQGYYACLQWGDLVISEIMADPYPPVELPEVEYIEIYNRTKHPQQIKSCVLRWGEKEFIFPDMLLPSEACLICCGKGADSMAMSAYAELVQGIPKWSLLNAGCAISISSPRGEIIHKLDWNKSWYTNSETMSGGYSLELQQDEWCCLGRGNYQSSLDPQGGSPGNFERHLGELLPDLSAWEIYSSSSLKFHLNYDLDDLTGWSKAAFRRLENGEYAKAVLSDQQGNYILTFETPWEEGESISLQLNLQLEDCQGNSFAITDAVVFKIPSTIERGALFFSEILFNPFPTQTAYIELEFKGQGNYLLSELEIAYASGIANPKSFKQFSEKPHWLKSGEMILLAADTNLIKKRVLCEEEHILFCALPFNLHNESGNLLLRHQVGDTIAQMTYSEEMHHPAIQNFQGIALEHIVIQGQLEESFPWISAASSTSYGTPGCPNSHQFMTTTIESGDFEMLSETFSPNNDGFEDFLEICWNTEKLGQLQSVLIYNREGLLVKSLSPISWEIGAGCLQWDGCDEDDNLLPMGIYIVLIQARGSGGKKILYKEACILVGK